jgi:gamma-D-glutamyl-L-lysine dipeptidyl-peptidase
MFFVKANDLKRLIIIFDGIFNEKRMQGYGICKLSMVPMRKTPSDRDEIVNQLLFGELVVILSKKKQWLLLKCEWDGYEGWVDFKQIKTISEPKFESYRQKFSTAFEISHTAISDNYFLPVTIGATLPLYDGIQFELDGLKMSYSGRALDFINFKGNAEWIIKIARLYLYSPYLWGGRSPFGIDCSGLTQIVFKLAGYRLYRDAYQQAEQGNLIDFIELAQPGDLAFFENDKGNIIHVGIIMADNKVLHASGFVRVDSLDHNGIFNIETKKYSHKLRVIKRIIGDELMQQSILDNQHENLKEEIDLNQSSLF